MGSLVYWYLGLSLLQKWQFCLVKVWLPNYAVKCIETTSFFLWEKGISIELWQVSAAFVQDNSSLLYAGHINKSNNAKKQILLSFLKL